MNTDVDALELEVSIDNFERSGMEGGREAYIFYLKIYNKSPNRRKVRVVAPVMYITEQREQIQQDCWLTGFFTNEAMLEANTFQLAGVVIYTNKLNSIRSNEFISATIELPEEGKSARLSFKNTGNSYELANIEPADSGSVASAVINPERPTPLQQSIKDLLGKIDRLEMFEDKYGVRFDKISIKLGNGTINIFGELHAKNGSSIPNDIYIQCILYDSEGMILDQNKQLITADDFLAFKVFEILFCVDGLTPDTASSIISKIRLIPQKS